MTYRHIAALLLVGGLFTDCNCNEKLASALGAIDVALCDRGSACACTPVLTGDVVDFGGPAVGTTALRTLTISNSHPARKLTISHIEVAGGDAFQVIGVRRRESAESNATVTSVNLENDVLVLEGDAQGEVVVALTPTSADPVSATLTIVSDAEAHQQFDVRLVSGTGSSTVCSSTDCGELAKVDFGTFTDDELSASFDEVRAIVVSNTGDTEMFVSVELTNDGIPETLPGELPGVGSRVIFSIGDELGCAVVPPGGALEVPVHYRPFTAGEHQGEVILHAAGAPVHVPLFGKVIGAHICFTTEDDRPDDGKLQYGPAPSYQTASNVSETRKIWVRNCGYQEDLVVSGVSVPPSSSPAFSTPALPWTATTPLAADASQSIEMAVTLTPTGSGPLAGRYVFASNDRFRPQTYIDLVANIGEPERCILVPSTQPFDMGWVATDEAMQGDCELGTPACPGIAGHPKISRRGEVRLLNAGQRPCTEINLATVTSSAGGTFSVEQDGNAPGFTLNPGESSDPITVLFVTDVSDSAQTFFGALPYSSPDSLAFDLKVNLRIKAGGSPACDLAFQPVSPGNAFCPSASLAFGNVNLGQDKTIDMKVINIGAELCHVTNVRASAGTDAAFTFPTTSFDVPVNTFTILPVTFAPVSVGSDPFAEFPLLCGQNAIQMSVNSGVNGAVETKQVNLSGNVTRPDIDVIPGEVDFGLVTVGCCSAERRVAIYNSGDGTLSISSVGVLSTSDPGFSTTQPGDMELLPGENTELSVRFCAGSVGAASGIVEIQSSDDNEEYYAIALSGEGTLDNSGHDPFQQPARPQVDVLWVVDDSGSMSDEQALLATNFDYFINTATALDTDYHLGVVSTDADSDEAGKLYACAGNPLWITDAQAAAQQRDQFRCNVNTSNYSRPHSDSREAALEAGRMALDYPNIDGYNAGFYRETAKLYVILVTDEMDQSNGPPQLYVDFFQNLKGIGNPDLLNISAISGPPPDGCPGAGGNQPGLDAVTAVGGQFRSICAADWVSLISSLGLDVFNARHQFPLSRPADAASLTIQICDDDGSGHPAMPSCVTVPFDATNGWTFDASVNAVTFHGTFVPGASQHVLVDYSAVCMP